MNTISSVLALHKDLIDSDSSRLDCELLLCDVLKKNRAYLYTWPEKELTDEQFFLFKEVFERRKQGEPIAYILGRKEFWSLSFNVNESTLIPRPETELLVESVLTLLHSQIKTATSVLDLGTGTGAIALALASECPDWHLVGVDKQFEAVDLAKENASKMNLHNVHFYQSDWFNALENKTFSVIVSNPPYIDAKDPHLGEGDVRYEPRSALVANEAGLADLSSIIQQSPLYLEAGGWLLLEHGFQQGDAVRALLEKRGFTHVETRLDLAGLPRVSLGQFASA